MKYVHKKVLSIKVCEMSPLDKTKLMPKLRRESHFRNKNDEKKGKMMKKSNENSVEGENKLCRARFAISA